MFLSRKSASHARSSGIGSKLSALAITTTPLGVTVKPWARSSSSSKPIRMSSGIETPLSMIARRIFARRPMFTPEKRIESSTSE